jgi:guanylate kinase
MMNAETTTSEGENPAPAAPRSNALLFLISAPSGGGKTTLEKQLLAALPRMARAVTCTTRPPRPGERDGVDYYFLDAAAFLKKVEAGSFLEHALVHGNRYGTLKTEVLGKLRQGQDVLLDVDVQGAATVRARAQEDSELRRALVSVFLTPPSLAVLEARLRKRGTETAEVLELRLSAARREAARWQDFDYLILSGTISDDLQRALAIIQAEKLRTRRLPAPEL